MMTSTRTRQELSMIEGYERPAYESLLAGAPALMTGYAQSAEADIDPARWLAADRRIANNLVALRQRPEAPASLQKLIDRLAGCRCQMACCTALSTPPGTASATASPTRH
jgi:hypothetical protein